MEISPATGDALVEPLRLLERWLRDGEPVPEAFERWLRAAVEAGVYEVLVARTEGRVVGVAVTAYRLSFSLGGPFASVEGLYVEPEARRRGVGRALLETAAERCSKRGVSYVEAQVESKEAAVFYRTLGYEEERDVRVFSRSYVL
ncbi:MAG: GNAT family N-acetyltransferase [Actinomycetota bacterium]